MIRRKRPTLEMSKYCLVALLALLATNSIAQNRSGRSSEGEIAIELFGLIAIQSNCDLYIVAWINRATRQIEGKCAETIEQSEQIATTTAAETRFIIDVETAKADYKTRFEQKSFRRSASVLAHLLTNERNERRSPQGNAPLLIYLQETRGKLSNDVKNQSNTPSPYSSPISIFKPN